MDLVSTISILSDPWQFAAGATVASAVFGGRKVLRRKPSSKAIVKPSEAQKVVSLYGPSYATLDSGVSKLEEQYEKIVSDFSVTFPRLNVQEYCPDATVREARDQANTILVALDTIKNTHLTQSQLESFTTSLKGITTTRHLVENTQGSLNRFAKKLTANVELVAKMRKAEENYLTRMEAIMARRNEAFQKFSPTYIANLNPLILSIETNELAKLKSYLAGFVFVKNVETGAKAHVNKLCSSLNDALTLIEQELEHIFDYSIIVRKAYTVASRRALDNRMPRNAKEKIAHKEALASIVESEMASYDVRDPEEEYRRIIKPYATYIVDWDKVSMRKPKPMAEECA